MLWPRSDSGNAWQNFPRDFKIQVWDGANWITRVTRTGYQLDRLRGQEFTWGFSDTTNRVRIDATSLTNGAGGYMLQLAEVQVFNDDNLAAGVAGTRATSSSSADSAGWNQQAAVDGFVSSFGGQRGWSSDLGITAPHQEYVEVELPCRTSFSKVTLYPRDDAGFAGRGFPSGLQIQVWDGARWVTRVSRTDIPRPDRPDGIQLGIFRHH